MNYPKIVQSNNPSKPSVTNDFTNNVESNSTDKDNKMNSIKLEKMNSIKLEIMNSSEGYGTYFKKGDTYKEVFGNFGSDPNTTTPK
jgi:hypothetical protein